MSDSKSAQEAVALTKQLGDIIEQLTNHGCIVSLEIWFNEGSESMTLHRLNGEFNLEIGRYQSLTETTDPNSVSGNS